MSVSMLRTRAAAPASKIVDMSLWSKRQNTSEWTQTWSKEVGEYYLKTLQETGTDVTEVWTRKKTFKKKNSKKKAFKKQTLCQGEWCETHQVCLTSHRLLIT